MGGAQASQPSSLLGMACLPGGGWVLTRRLRLVYEQASPTTTGRPTARCRSSRPATGMPTTGPGERGGEGGARVSGKGREGRGGVERGRERVLTCHGDGVGCGVVQHAGRDDRGPRQAARGQRVGGERRGGRQAGRRLKEGGWMVLVKKDHHHHHHDAHDGPMLLSLVILQLQHGHARLVRRGPCPRHRQEPHGKRAWSGQPRNRRHRHSLRLLSYGRHPSSSSSSSDLPPLWCQVTYTEGPGAEPKTVSVGEGETLTIDSSAPAAPPAEAAPVSGR